GTRPESFLVQYSSEPPDIVFHRGRWLGLIQLVLMNAIISWTWLTFSPFSAISADFLGTTVTDINWLSIIFLFAFGAATPATMIILSRSRPKFAMVTGGLLIIIGSWVRYGAAQLDDNRFVVMLIGQAILGLAQPFALSAPVTYADMWFPPAGWASSRPNLGLKTELIAVLPAFYFNSRMFHQIPRDNMNNGNGQASTIALPAFFIPAAPPGRMQGSAQSNSLPMLRQLLTLLKSPEFWLMFFPFVLLIATFNSFSSIINQILEPHGFSDIESGIAGAILIGVGLVSAAITSPIIGRRGGQLRFIKIGISLLALSYLSFIWAPTAGTIVASYVCAGFIGAFSFSLLPVGLELIADVTHPIPASFSSAFFWMGGQLLGGVLLICVGFLKAGPNAAVPNNLDALGLFGRQEAMAVRRSNSYSTND
ncbi:MFS general substrate transporter, partial [Hyaloscypha variabilis F]